MEHKTKEWDIWWKNYIQHKCIKYDNYIRTFGVYNYGNYAHTNNIYYLLGPHPVQSLGLHDLQILNINDIDKIAQYHNEFILYPYLINNDCLVSKLPPMLL